MKPYTEGQRSRLLDLLKREGPQNAPQLARTLDLTLTAVRQQLGRLQRDGLVEPRLERRPRGRPSLIYRVTSKSDTLFPQAYGAYALGLLRQLRTIDGDKKMDRLFARRMQELIMQYSKRLRGLPLHSKLRELAHIRDEEGYMARPHAGGLTEHHCPIAALAKEFPQTCLYERKLFEKVLGMPLERKEHIASGGTACVYMLSQRKPT